MKDSKIKIAPNFYNKVDAITRINSLIQSKGAMPMGNLGFILLLPNYIIPLVKQFIYKGGG